MLYCVSTYIIHKYVTLYITILAIGNYIRLKYYILIHRPSLWPSLYDEINNINYIYWYAIWYYIGNYICILC